MHVTMVGDYPRSPESLLGGVEAVMLSLRENLEVMDDTRVSVITMDRWNLGEQTRRHGRSEIHYIEQSTRPGPFYTRQVVSRISRKIRELSPDIVHTHIAGFYSLGSAQSGLPWLLTAHGIRFLEAGLKPGWWEQLYRKAVIRALESRSMRLAPHIISINPFVEEQLGHHIRGTVHHIENPVPDCYFQPGGEPVPGQVLYSGRLIPRKDLATLLKGFAQTRTNCPQARLRIAGSPGNHDGSGYYQQLRDLVTELKLDDSVTFLGQLGPRQLLEELRSCQVLALTSILETAPMAIIEAMAAGRAIVTSDAGGCRYLVRNGYNGYVFPVADAVAAGTALERILSDPQHAQMLGKRGQDLARQRFHARMVSERTRKLYEQIKSESST